MSSTDVEKKADPEMDAQNSVDVNDVDSEKARTRASDAGSEMDLLMYHENNAGRLVIDPEYATRLSSPLFFI